MIHLNTIEHKDTTSIEFGTSNSCDQHLRRDKQRQAYENKKSIEDKFTVQV